MTVIIVSMNIYMDYGWVLISAEISIILSSLCLQILYNEFIVRYNSFPSFLRVQSVPSALTSLQREDRGYIPECGNTVFCITDQ
jgi:hypothetical protein